MGAGLLQPGHLLLILVIVLIVFGPGKLPELGSALGNGLRELKKSMNGEEAPPAPPPSMAATTTAPGATVAGAAAATSTCKHCSAPTPADARFCTRCGQTLAA